MKLLAFLETIKLREGFTDAAIQTAVPTAIETLRSDMMSGNDSGVAVELFRLHEYGDPHAEPDDNYEDMEYKYHEWYVPQSACSYGRHSHLSSHHGY